MFKGTYQWYRNYIPPYGTEQFNKFLQSAGRLAGYVLETHNKRLLIEVYFRASQTAFSTIPENTITLPQWSLHPATWDKVDDDIEPIPVKDYGAATLVAVTALLIHEALHYVWSATTPEIQLSQGAHPLKDEFIKENQRAVIGLMQVLEDLYIEHQGMQLPYGFFIDEFNEVVLSERAMHNRYQTLEQEPTGARYTELLMTYKNYYNRADPLWTTLEDGVVDILEKALTADGFAKRATLALELYEILREYFQQDESQDYAQCSGVNWDNDDQGSGHFRNTPSEHTQSGKRSGRDSYDELEEIFDNFNDDDMGDELMKYIRHPLPDPLEFNENIPEVVRTEVSAASSRPSYRIQPSPEFRNFGRLLRNLRSKNYPPGPPLDKGQRIMSTRIHRIATDQKIFGFPYVRDVRQEAEIKLSINASGSMRSIYPKVLEAAYGVLQSLKDNRIGASVYAHTTVDRGSFYAPYLIHIADTTSFDLDDLFSKASGVCMGMSYDGAVLLELGKEFSKRPNQKVIFELNDGEPNCHGGYTGSQAVEHTKKSVEYLRTQGIIVVSLSLDREVVEPNNKIYGPRFNIDCTRGNLEAALQRALRDVLV